MGIVEDYLAAGGRLSPAQIFRIKEDRDSRKKVIADTLEDYESAKSQAERIAYLESRVMELKEEVRKARQR